MAKIAQKIIEASVYGRQPTPVEMEAGINGGITADLVVTCRRQLKLPAFELVFVFITAQS